MNSSMSLKNRFETETLIIVQRPQKQDCRKTNETRTKLVSSLATVQLVDLVE